MTPEELGQKYKAQFPQYANLDDTLIGQRALSVHPEYKQLITPEPENPRNFEPGVMGETDPTGQKILENATTAAAGYGMGQLGTGILSFGKRLIAPSLNNLESAISDASPVTKAVNWAQNIRNAPKTLEDALGKASETFGTPETPSMVGNTARAGLDSEQSLTEALAQKLYGQVPKDVPVSTPSLAAKFQEISDELPPGLGNSVKKNIQLEPNPVRPNDVGTTNTKIYGMSMPDETPVIPHQYTASPGTPTQLPANSPPVGDLIKLRSKLGAAARSGGIDGYNAGQLKAALDEDIANLGSSEGPIGKMTNEAVNDPLKQATSYYREMMGQQNTPLYKKLATGKVEDIPDIIFKNGRTQDVLEARAALGEQGFQAAKKSFFNDVINSKDVGKTLAKYSQNNSDFLQAAFNPQELRSLQTVAELQQKALDAAKTVDRAKMLMTGAGVAAVGGGIAGKAIKLGMGSK